MNEPLQCNNMLNYQQWGQSQSEGRNETDDMETKRKKQIKNVSYQTNLCLNGMYDARNDTIQLGPAPEQKYVEGQIIQHQILLSSVINHDERIFGKFHRTDEKFNERRVTTHPNQIHTACTLVQVHDGQGWCDTNTSGKGYNIVEINSGSKGAEVRTVYPNGAGCGTNDGLVQLFRPVTQCCNAHGRGILLRWVWKYTVV